MSPAIHFSTIHTGLIKSGRIEEIENKIGAGLIEEVIQVATGELQLVNVMLQARVYVFHQFPSFPLLPPFSVSFFLIIELTLTHVNVSQLGRS